MFQLKPFQVLKPNKIQTSNSGTTGAYQPLEPKRIPPCAKGWPRLQRKAFQEPEHLAGRQPWSLVVAPSRRPGHPLATDA